MLKLILGPMRSGKSMLVLREAEKLHYACKNYVIVRPENDTRDFISRSFKPEINLSIQRYYNGILNDYDYLIFDEIHLYPLNVIEEIKKSRKNIICAGIQNGVQAGRIQMLPNIIELFAYCDEVIKLQAVCESCGSFNGNFNIPRNGKVEIGDNYDIVCKDCISKFRNRIISSKLFSKDTEVSRYLGEAENYGISLAPKAQRTLDEFYKQCGININNNLSDIEVTDLDREKFRNKVFDESKSYYETKINEKLKERYLDDDLDSYELKYQTSKPRFKALEVTLNYAACYNHNVSKNERIKVLVQIEQLKLFRNKIETTLWGFQLEGFKFSLVEHKIKEVFVYHEGSGVEVLSVKEYAEKYVNNVLK